MTMMYGQTNPKSLSSKSGFTLIELMIVIAIVGILAAVAAPQYNTYQKRSRFSEVVLAVSSVKTAAEISVQTGRAKLMTDLNNDTKGIPSEITTSNSVGLYVSNVSISDGVILAIGTPEVDSATFTLEASILNDGIRWLHDETDPNSCQNLGFC